uniref:Protein TIC 214 n=1 Tax=Closterium baillyanum TaxID=1416941 RepID=A0A191T5Y4_9VIRI|nr:hypothetical chloroplast RF1 [Closterium baillyanum]ANI25804.1 hypothetical chloroplast RF1 [Closterium baillyanum]
MNNNYMFLLLLGSYYGFLATLPIGPSKLLCVRNFLITTKGSERLTFRLESANSILIAGISGLIVSQVIILLSIYFPSLYALWLRPHVFNLILLPVLFFYWHKIRLLETDTYNDHLAPQLYQTRIQTAFLETLFIQLLNPIILPNAVFSRLIGVFLFRYSNIITFIGGILLGFLAGYTAFVLLSFYLLRRLEQDTPTIYRLVKRVIHQAFFPVFFIICLICLGRNPVPSIKNFTFHLESWQTKPWPDVFYSYDAWKRPLRLLINNKTGSADDNIRAFNKMHFSQFFFEIDKKDGKRKLYHNYPQSLSLVSRDFHELLQIPDISQESEQKIFDEWIKTKATRKQQIEKSIHNRLFSFGKGTLLEDIVEKRIGSINYNNGILSKAYDPRLGIDTRRRESKLQNESPLVVTESDLVDPSMSLISSENTTLLDISTKNNLKLFLSKNANTFQNCPINSWQPERTNGSIDIENPDRNSQNVGFVDGDSWSRLARLKKENVQSWNNILYKIQTWIANRKNHESRNNTLGDPENLNTPENISRLLNMYKPIPLWNSQIKKADLETPEANEYHSIVANFVRRLLPGSMRSRRRKALLWNTYQNRPHAPIFLRAIDSLNLEESVRSDQDDNVILVKAKQNESKQKAQILKNRWNFSLAHLPRGIALFGQVYIRRYIKLPILIVLKNISRQLLFQPTEWQKDWSDLSKEVYIDCDYDGNDLYVGVKLPAIPTLQGKQVKIVRPFNLRYWGTLKAEEHSTDSIRIANGDKLANYELDNYSYLTIWGDETSEPFGSIKRSPAFWQPILQRINLIIRHKIYNKYHALGERLEWVNKYKKEFGNIISKITSNVSTVLQINPEQTDLSTYSTEKKEFAKRNVEKLTENTKIITSIEVGVSQNGGNVVKEEINSSQRRKTSELVGLSSTNALKEKDYTHTINKPITKIFHDENAQELSRKHTSHLHRTQEELYNNTKTKPSVDLTTKKIRKYTWKKNLIDIQKNLFHFKRSLVQIQKNVRYELNKKRVAIYRNLVKNSKKILQILKEVILSIRKLLFNTNTWLSEILNASLWELRSLGNQTHTRGISNKPGQIGNGYSSTYNPHLSQAYVLHTIWQENEMNRPNITSLLQTWNEEKLLKKKLQVYLPMVPVGIKQGIFQNKEAENITHKHWNQWIRSFPGYTPSFKVWRHIVPQYWTQAVAKYWDKFSDPITGLTADTKLSLHKHILPKGPSTGVIDNYLSYHTPLLEKAEKFTKLWHFYLISRNYTHFVNDADVEILQNFQTNKIAPLSHNNLNKINSHIDDIKTDKLVQNQSYSPFHTSATQKDTFSRLMKPQAKNIELSPIQSDLLKELPIIQKEITRMNSNLELHTLSDRISFPRVREKKWKSKDLRNRFRNLLKAVKQKNVLKESMMDNKQVIGLSNKMRKDLNIFSQNSHPADVLFISMVENWHYKVLDDELLMYNIVSSFLRFTQKEQSELAIGKTIKSYILKNNISDVSSLIPEELLLPKTMRELRILESLNLKAPSYEDEQINMNSAPSHLNNRHGVNITKQLRKENLMGKKNIQTFNEKETIMRFLWPTHRIEDLACMNRLWLGATNQSRFSLLRTRPFVIN